jgi:hypothetical protein
VKKAAMNFCSLMVVLGLSFGMSGCATEGKSVGFGAMVGAGTGAALGGVMDPGKKGQYRTRNVIVGSALGAMTGMIAASAIHKDQEAEKRDAFLKGKASAPTPVQGAMPALKSPKVETHWIEGRVVGNRFIEGHFEYVITEAARWEDK